jgi:hypothetical protein
MRSSALAVCLLLLMMPTFGAADEKTPKKELTPAQEAKKLVDDYQLDQQEFSRLLREAKTDADRQKITEQKMPKPDAAMDRLLELAIANPKDKGVVPGALIWIVKQGANGSAYVKRKDTALELLLNYVHNPQVAEVCASLPHRPSPHSEKLLRAIEEKGPTPDAKGKATFNLAKYYKYTVETSEKLKELTSPEEVYTKEVLKYLQDVDADAMTKDADKLFTVAVKKYPEVPVMGNRLAGEVAEEELFELRNLAIGKFAPQIEGFDLDGKKLKLSDYKGKVVVLDFWGNW